jgi:undecaprenyl pyrophosphate synthase
MTTYKGINGFGNSPGDSITENSTEWYGKVGMPKGKLSRYPSAVADISSGNRRLAKSKHGSGGGSGTAMKGVNAFSKGK